MLDAQAAERGGTAEPVGERGAAVASQVVEESAEGPGMRPVKGCYLLLRTKCGDDLN